MRKLFATLLLGVMMSTTLLGKWASVPLDELVDESDLIVVGTLHSAVEDEYGIGSGRINVEEVIAGNAKTLDGVPLIVGNDLRIEWADDRACAAGMHQRRIGERGIWLLDVREDGTVGAAYPGKFTKLDVLPKIRHLLRSHKAKRATIVDVSYAHEPSTQSPEKVTVAPIQLVSADVSPDSEYSAPRAIMTLFIAIGLYWIVYRSRFRIR